MKGVMQTLFLHWRRMPSGWEAIDPLDVHLRYRIEPTGPGYVLHHAGESMSDLLARPEEAAWIASHRVLRHLVQSAGYQTELSEPLLAIVRASLPATPLEEPSPWPNAPLSTNPSMSTT